MYLVGLNAPSAVWLVACGTGVLPLSALGFLVLGRRCAGGSDRRRPRLSLAAVIILVIIP